MLCQSCFEKTATTHIKTMLNGVFKEYMLCPECAKKLGYMNFFEDFGTNFGNFLGNFLDNSTEKNAISQDKKCKLCGSSFRDIVNTGKVGCAHCYEVFYDEIIPSIHKIHGNTKHIGRMSASENSKSKFVNEVDELKLKLAQAIEKQEFEEAAKLRDKIKGIEKEVNKND